MIIFPIFDKIIEWAKNYAKPINPCYYWCGLLTIVIIGSIFLHLLIDYGFNTAKPFLGVLIFSWIIWFVVAIRFFTDKTSS